MSAHSMSAAVWTVHGGAKPLVAGQPGGEPLAAGLLVGHDELPVRFGLGVDAADLLDGAGGGEDAGGGSGPGGSDGKLDCPGPRWVHTASVIRTCGLCRV
jgi:hypothetical protein